jgi:hypothetical protein
MTSQGKYAIYFSTDFGTLPCGSGDGPLGGTQVLGKYLEFTGKVGPFAVRCARRAVRRYAQREIEYILASEIRALRPTIRTTHY